MHDLRFYAGDESRVVQDSSSFCPECTFGSDPVVFTDTLTVEPHAPAVFLTPTVSVVSSSTRSLPASSRAPPSC